MLAYVGWPNADEAHADSAVRAGLAAIEALRPHQLPVRGGIATGLVVVGDLIGAGASQEHSAIGETPNLAARLQALADPDTIVVSEATRAQPGRMFEMEALGPVTLKGFENPVNAWRARRETEASSRSEAVYAGGLTPLVGRHEELDLLLRRWREAKVGAGRIVLLSGEAGIGKSRLLAALEESLASHRDSSVAAARNPRSPWPLAGYGCRCGYGRTAFPSARRRPRMPPRRARRGLPSCSTGILKASARAVSAVAVEGSTLPPLRARADIEAHAPTLLDIRDDGIDAPLQSGEHRGLTGDPASAQPTRATAARRSDTMIGTDSMGFEFFQK